MNKRIRISACLMVKDEEKNLARCLNSIREIADEIIVVDTGSTDKTIQIARTFGAQVYEHPWQNDFSYHRNQTIDYATGDFVLIVDADEEIIRNAPVSKLRELLRDLPEQYESLIIDIQDIQRGDIAMQFQSARIFRRGAVRYQGIVHNRPITASNAGLVTNFLALRHYGYDLTPAEKEKKFHRTASLLLSRLERDPADYVCHFYLAQLYMGHDEREKGIEHGEIFAAYRDKPDFNEAIWFSLARTSMELKRNDQAARWLKEGLARNPDDLDLYFGMTELGVSMKDIELVMRGAKNYMRIWDEHQKAPVLLEKKFIYTAKTRSMAWVAGAIAITCLEYGTSALKMLMDMAPQLEPEYANSLVRTIQAALQETPITINFDTAEPAQKLAVVSAK